MVLLHGIASSTSTFARIAPALGEHFRVIGLDLLGFGGSIARPDQEFTLETHVEAVLDSLAALRIRGPVVFVGHSMGCLIALRIAARHPRRVAALVLASPPLYPDPEELLRTDDPLLREAIRLRMWTYDFLRKNPAFTQASARRLERLPELHPVLHLDADSWPAFAGSLEHVIEEQTALAELRTLEMPVRIVYGSLDPFVVPRVFDGLEDRPNVSITRVDGVDHLIRPSLAEAVVAAVEKVAQRR